MGGVAYSSGVDTHWTLVHTFNGALYITMIGAIVLLFLGTFFFPIWFCGCCTLIYGNCGHLAALIITGVLRYSDDGSFCAKQKVELADGITFEDHGTAMEGLFISQCVLYCFFGCCVGFLMQISAQTGGMAFAKMFGR